MGLKTTNYKVKTGDILPEAYAIFSDIKKLGNNYFEATFSIYRERDAFNKTAPYETKSVKFIWDRKKDLVAKAYEESKAIKEQTVIDNETNEEKTIEIKGVFFGWEDDIVGE
jgi:hypothetical protein